MELQGIKINNYKSLVDLEIKKPNPFTVFAGPNGAGKSNIFEALEFASYLYRYKPDEVANMFGGISRITNYQAQKKVLSVAIEFHDAVKRELKFSYEENDLPNNFHFYGYGQETDENSHHSDPNENANRTKLFKKFFTDFTRVFINKAELNRIQYNSGKKLLPDASNMPFVLNSILSDPNKKDEFLDWVQLFVPGLSNIEVRTDSIEGTASLLIYEKGTNKPFNKSLISDGTYNILTLLTAVYQADEPQFLCIEEPENGLNPYVVESLVSFFRKQCEEKGHYIWLNTHSQTLVKHLQPQELILVEKKNSKTQIK